MSLAERFKAKTPATVPIATPFWPDWDGKVYVRKISAGRARNCSRIAAAEDEASKAGKPLPEVEYWQTLLVGCLCDSAGVLLFPADQVVEAYVLLGNLNWDDVRPVFNAAAEHNGLTKTAAEQAEKNSEPTPSGDLPSSSAAPSESSIPISS